MIVTDLNDRERHRYAQQIGKVSEAARSLAEALRSGDDTTALVQLALLGLSGNVLNELTDIFMKTVDVSVPDAPPPL